MEDIKLILKNVGCTKEEIEVSIQAITNINGDHIEIYRHINALCKAQDDLAHTKSLIKQLGFTQEPSKRPHKRKEPKQSLLDKSGVNAASESLKEQRQPSAAVIAVDELLGEHGRTALNVKPVKKPSKRRKESGDELTGAVKANNLTIDL